MQPFSADLHSQLAVLAQVAIAMALGGAVGIEREMSNKPAAFAPIPWLLARRRYSSDWQMYWR